MMLFVLVGISYWLMKDTGRSQTHQQKSSIVKTFQNSAEVETFVIKGTLVLYARLVIRQVPSTMVNDTSEQVK